MEDERLRFVVRRLDGELMTALCAEFGISRKTGNKIFDRYKDYGVQGLSDRSRRPYRHANQLPLVNVEPVPRNARYRRVHTAGFGDGRLSLVVGVGLAASADLVRPAMWLFPALGMAPVRPDRIAALVFGVATHALRLGREAFECVHHALQLSHAMGSAICRPFRDRS